MNPKVAAFASWNVSYKFLTNFLLYCDEFHLLRRKNYFSNSLKGIDSFLERKKLIQSEKLMFVVTDIFSEVLRRHEEINPHQQV